MANILEIILKAVKQGSGFKDTERDTNSLSKAVGGLNKLLGGLGLAVGAKELFDFGAASVAAARESAAAEGELQAALISSGQASEEYTAQLQSLATALENTSLFTDEQVIKAEATLATFKNLGQDVMPRTIQVVADMGQKMGDLGTAAQLAGIVLNNPTQATARLQRQGILLTDTQKQQIATMIEMGNTAGAQGILLDVLTTKFGGQAQAARDAAGGAQDWAVSVGRLQEAMGGLLLAIGDSGVGGASVGLVDTLAEGATVWTTNVEQLQLFVDALNRANAELNNTAGTSASATAELSEFQKAQAGWGIILTSVTHAAIESTVGWDALAEAYGEVEQEAADAAAAMEETAQAANDMSGASNRAALSSYASMRGMMAQAGAARELEDAFRQSAAAAASAQAASSFGGQQDTFTQNLNLTQLQQVSDARLAAQAEKKAQEEDAAAESERIFTQSTQAMVSATNELGNQIASAVSSAVSQSSTDIAQLLGITPEGEARVNEGVRRMAAVATGGLANEWTQGLATQLQGVDAAQAFVNAVSTGNNAAAMEEARKLAVNPIVELFDANAIAAGIEQQLRAQQLQQVLNDKVNALLGEKGLPAVAAISQQVGQAATDTGLATGQVQQSTTDMAASAEAAAQKVGAAFAGALPMVDLLNERLKLMAGLIERVNVLAGQAGGSIAGMNPPAANGSSLVPNEAQRRMGPFSPQ